MSLSLQCSLYDIDLYYSAEKSVYVLIVTAQAQASTQLKL